MDKEQIESSTRKRIRNIPILGDKSGSNMAETVNSIHVSLQKKIDKTEKPVITIVLLLLGIAIVDAFSTSNESGLATLILENLKFPLAVLSVFMAAYWILLTDDFWLICEGSDTEIWTKIKTGLKFIVWIPGMALYFFAVTQGLLSAYNRSMGEQKAITLDGQLVNKDHQGSRLYFEIRDQKLGRSVEIRVNQSEFERFKIGDTYQTTRKIGALGLIYDSHY